MATLEAKITDLEDRSRRSNLVVFGIPEPPEETEDMLKEAVLTEVFEHKLEVKCKSVGRIHRLGKPGGSRPVIVYFQDYNEKQQTISNARKLKGTDISVQNDYSKETLRKRKLLWNSAKEEKRQGKKVNLVHDKLMVDRDRYVWDDCKNSRIKIASSQSSKHKT